MSKRQDIPKILRHNYVLLKTTGTSGELQAVQTIFGAKSGVLFIQPH